MPKKSAILTKKDNYNIYFSRKPRYDLLFRFSGRSYSN